MKETEGKTECDKQVLLLTVGKEGELYFHLVGFLVLLHFYHLQDLIQVNL